MKTILTFLLIILYQLSAISQNTHRDPTHNFTVHRIIIINDQNEILMGREQTVWATPSLLYNQRQFVKEGLDSLANEYGVTINSIKLHGQFSYKYDYHPHATLRNFYVARCSKSRLILPENIDEVAWIPIEEAIDKNTVTSIREITKQIIDQPNTVWGGSFLVSRKGKEHPTKMIEEFYPLF